MKKYIKPAIEVVTMSSSTPIAYKTCTGDNQADYDYVQEFIDGAAAPGKVCANYVWTRGSN